MRYISLNYIAAVCLIGWLVVPAVAADGDRMTAEKLLELGRIGDAAISPDGTHVAYLVTRFDLAADTSSVSLYLQQLDKLSSDGRLAKGFGTPLASGSTTLLLEGVKSLNSLSWIRRPEGDRLLYVAPGKSDDSNGKKAKSQAWLMDPNQPEAARQITHIEQGIANLKPSPTGQAIAFTVNIKLDPTVNDLYPDLPKADARIIDSLMFRHWNSWHDFTYSHLHVAELMEDGTAAEAWT